MGQRARERGRRALRRIAAAALLVLLGGAAIAFAAQMEKKKAPSAAPPAPNAKPPGQPAPPPAPAPAPAQTPAQAPGLEGPPAAITYDLLYDVRISPNAKEARVAIRISGPQANLVHALRLRVDPDRHQDWKGDGDIDVKDHAVVWKPPATGGVLRYTFRIDHLRDARSYDAHFAENWTLFRGDDLVPRTRVKTEGHPLSHAQLRLRLPTGWHAAVPFEKLPDGRYAIDNPRRRFDRPTGWLLLGHLGILRERIAGARVAVAAPVGQRVHRLDMLALMRWSLPQLRKLLGSLPPRLLVVGAGDPMWRGGLSGPGSVFLHAERPLIESDVTSPILHELIHATVGITAGKGGDWVVEGLAELYSLELLQRSHTISRLRYDKALEHLAQRGATVPALDVDVAVGPIASRAAAVLHQLDLELRRGSDGRITLDDVLRRLANERGRMTTERFRHIVDDVAGRSLGAFFRARVPLKQQPALP